MEWISIEDRLPKAYEVVLVLTTYNRHHEAHHHGEEVPRWEDCLCQPLSGVTHWMPLPEPPKEKE